MVVVGHTSPHRFVLEDLAEDRSRLVAVPPYPYLADEAGSHSDADAADVPYGHRDLVRGLGRAHWNVACRSGIGFEEAHRTGSRRHSRRDSSAGHACPFVAERVAWGDGRSIGFAVVAGTVAVRVGVADAGVGDCGP
jgi:hypothetical protein